MERKLPADFADYYAAHTIEETAYYFDVSKTQVYEWVRDNHLYKRSAKPTADELKALYPAHTREEIAELYGVQIQTVRKWLVGAGLVQSRKNDTSEIPADFRERYPLMSNKDLAEHYGVTKKKIEYWAGKAHCHKYDTSYMEI